MPEADRLLRHLQSEHVNEPGIAQGMFQILVDAGIVRPDGTPVAAARADRNPAWSCPARARPKPARFGLPAAINRRAAKSRLCGRLAINSGEHCDR